MIYGQAPSWPTIELPNNITIYGAIYAPNTGIQFKNNGNVVGGITAQSVEFKNNAFMWDSRLTDLHLATTLVYYRGAWRQCNSRVSSTTAPCDRLPARTQPGQPLADAQHGGEQVAVLGDARERLRRREPQPLGVA